MAGIDVLLLSDEPVDWEGDYRSRSSEQLENQMRALVFTKADKDEVEKKFGIRDYFRPLAVNAAVGGERQEQLYRIRVPHRPHLSLCDLATVLQAAGYEVRVVDNMLRFPSRMEQVRKLLRDKPKLVGLSTTFLITRALVRQYVDIIKKEMGRETKLVLGGPSIRKFKDLHGCCDFAVFGDGEEAILAIMEYIEGKRRIDSIPNTAYTREDGIVIYGPGATVACRLGRSGKPYKAAKVQIPVADWRTVHRSYSHVFPIEFSRGCRNNCFYCSYDRGKTIRSLGEIREELKANAKLGIRKYRIGDSDFNSGPLSYEDYPDDICKIMIDLGLDLEWSCFARVDGMTDELADLMRQAGCFAVFFGVESGDDSVLQKMNKGFTATQAFEGIQIAKKHGLACHASFIVGYPGETRESFENTLELIIKARPDTVNLGQFRVEHDTIVYGKKEFKLKGLGMTWTHVTMNNEMADALVLEGNERLLKNGICLGTECGYPTFMGLGQNLEGALQTMKHLDTVGVEEKKGTAEHSVAKGRLRDLMLHEFPAYIRDDQRAWEDAAIG